MFPTIFIPFICFYYGIAPEMSICYPQAEPEYDTQVEGVVLEYKLEHVDLDAPEDGNLEREVKDGN